MTSPTTPRRTRHRSALAGVLLAATSGLTVLTAPAAHAATVVMTWDELNTALSAGGTVDVRLGATISGDGISIPPGEDLTLDLAGHHLTLDGYYRRDPGLGISGASVTINDSSAAATGALTARGGGEGAGIGSDWDRTEGGNVTINGGTIDVIAGTEGGAGIGGTDSGDGGTITINGGSVTAFAWSGAGIGGGIFADGGTITINGGTVDASAWNGGAAIGGGPSGAAGHITINGGSVNATGGYYASAIGGGSVGYGGAASGAGGLISIGAGATVVATAGNASAATIGSNGGYPYGSVTNDGDVTIVGNNTVYSTFLNTGHITIAGGFIGSGVVTNAGTIVVAEGGYGLAAETPMTRHHYEVTYDVSAAGADAPSQPAPQRVFAATFADGQVELPDPPAGFRWSTAPSDGTEVTATTDLADTFGENLDPNLKYGATEVTLHAVLIPPNAPPVAALSASPSTIVTGQSVAFDTAGTTDPDGPSDLAGWRLSFGDGAPDATGTGAPPASVSHAYAATGSFPATLTVTDTAGQSSGATANVTVNRAATTLVAATDSARISVLSLLNITVFLHPTATLTRSWDATPIAGRSITFTTTSGQPICTATTDSQGRAACRGTLHLPTVAGLGYRADFTGDGSYTSSTAVGSVLTIGG